MCTLIIHTQFYHANSSSLVACVLMTVMSLINSYTDNLGQKSLLLTVNHQSGCVLIFPRALTMNPNSNWKDNQYTFLRVSRSCEMGVY